MYLTVSEHFEQFDPSEVRLKPRLIARIIQLSGMRELLLRESLAANVCVCVRASCILWHRNFFSSYFSRRARIHGEAARIINEAFRKLTNDDSDLSTARLTDNVCLRCITLSNAHYVCRQF